MITEGSPVRFRKEVENKESQAILDGWVEVYGRGPYKARCIVGRYLALFRPDGTRLPLGAGEGLINMGFVEPA